MKHVTDLLAGVADKVAPPVCVALGPPLPVAHLVEALGGVETVCFQMDLHQAAKLQRILGERNTPAEVVTAGDLWDLPARFKTVIFPAGSGADRELKLDIVEQGFHILEEGGLFLTLSEYRRDDQFAKWHKKIFGRCGETPASKAGMAFWSRREGDQPRRRHEVSFHARTGDGPSMNFVTRPGVFSYGRFDDGSRAMLEVAEINEGDHILDLGSGVGAVGCLAGAKAGPTGRVTFVDSSLRATQLSELNAKANGLTGIRVLAAPRLEGLGMNEFDVILANPPYYSDSAVARLFVQGSRDLLKPGGRYYIVTKMPTAVVPHIFETFGDCHVVENRGYSIVVANA